MSVATARTLAWAARNRFQNGGQGLGAFAVADEDHGAGAQVEDQREVAVPLADGHLVDGDFLEVLELGLAERLARFRFWMSLMMSQLTPQMVGDVLDGA